MPVKRPLVVLSTLISMLLGATPAFTDWLEPPHPKHAPKGALEVGTENSRVYKGKIYVCKVATKRGIRLGFLRLGKGCTYPLRNRPHVEGENYQVLGNLHEVEWILASHPGHVPDDAIYVGKENSPAFKGKVYVCAVHTPVGFRPGMLRAGEGCVYLRSGDSKIKRDEYSVLVESNRKRTN